MRRRKKRSMMRKKKKKRNLQSKNSLPKKIKARNDLGWF
jgi:hypothetical protein